MTKEPPEIVMLKPNILQSAHERRLKAAADPKPDPGLTPYGYLMEIMRDNDADPYLRVMAAEALLPYCHKKGE